MITNVCNDCRYCVAPMPDSESGDCRRYAPTSNKISWELPKSKDLAAAERFSEEACIFVWPSVWRDGVACGDFAPVSTTGEDA